MSIAKAKYPVPSLRFRRYPNTWAGWRKLLRRCYCADLGGMLVPVGVSEAFLRWALEKRGKTP